MQSAERRAPSAECRPSIILLCAVYAACPGEKSDGRMVVWSFGRLLSTVNSRDRASEWLPYRPYAPYFQAKAVDWTASRPESSRLQTWAHLDIYTMSRPRRHGFAFFQYQECLRHTGSLCSAKGTWYLISIRAYRSLCVLDVAITSLVTFGRFLRS